MEGEVNLYFTKSTANRYTISHFRVCKLKTSLSSGLHLNTSYQVGKEKNLTGPGISKQDQIC